MTDAEIIREAAARLTDWYRRNRRDLPWRCAPTPYHVWISEIMLQQTRIEAVLGYYARFLEALPELSDLAAVEEDRLLKLWEGLGYYSRARNLKKAAGQVMERYGGVLPRSAAELKTLPGIGDYTAGAIASIAYGEPEPAVDGNVLRVVMRLLACPDDVLLPATRRRVTELLRAAYPRGEEAALLTEGIMELGETLCAPNAEARCDLCPLSGLCRACRNGSAREYPVRSPAKERRRETRTVLLLRCGEAFAIRRRPETGLLAGLWEYPNFEGDLGPDELSERLGVPLRCTPCGNAKHVFTHVEWQMHGYLADCETRPVGFDWHTAREIEESFPIPTAFRQYRKIMLKQA
ncbi:MAG: A/G-specific adenine glycosylase [Oscillospiraceae bacterium]|nr:A/G-specific adenine glycosylase [Oscillospiraceae bacterium]